jgi:hypothetical protein
LTELYRSKYFVWTGDPAKIKGIISPFYSFLDKAYLKLCDDFGFNLEANLPIKVTIDNSDECVGGTGGRTGGGELAYCAGVWADNHWCSGLVLHELVNLFTGEGVSGGWPTHWWVNGRSPFPVLISIEVMKQLGKTAQARERDCVFAKDVWYGYFKKLHKAKGWTLWRALFAYLREIDIDLSKIPEPQKSDLLMSLISFFCLAV